MKREAVYLEWIDHHSQSHQIWGETKDIQIDNRPCKSIGFILKETKDWLIIAGHLADNDSDEYSGDMHVYKKCILKRVPIKLKEFDKTNR